MIHKF